VASDRPEIADGHPHATWDDGPVGGLLHFHHEARFGMASNPIPAFAAADTNVLGFADGWCGGGLFLCRASVSLLTQQRVRSPITSAATPISAAAEQQHEHNDNQN
jgi:hypothetical protein